MTQPNILTSTEGGSRDLTTIDGQTLHVDMKSIASILPGVEPYSVVVKPGATPGGNVYASWAAMRAVVDAILQPGTPVRCLFDDTIVSPIHITPQAGDVPWNVNNWSIYGTDNPTTSSASQIVFDDGAHWTLQFGDWWELTIGNNGTTPAIAGTNTTAFLFGVVFGTGTNHQPVFSCGAAGSPESVNLFNVGTFCGDGTNPFVTVAAGGFFAWLGFDSSTLSANAVVGPGAAGSFYEYDASSIPDAANLGTRTPVDLAQGVAYTPAVPGNWQPAPTEVAAALDQLAAPNTLTEKNAAGIGPLGTVPFDTTGTISKKRSGKVLVTATMSGSGSTPTDGVTLFLRMDGVNQGPPANVFTEVGTAPNAAWSGSLSWVFTLPDALPHTFGIVAVDTAAGTLTVPISGAGVTAVEL
jgi:hypothetical protein